MADETDRRKEQDADFEGDDQRSGQDRRQGDRRAAAADKHGKGYYATWGFAAGVLPAIALLLMIRFDDPVKRRGTCGAQIIRTCIFPRTWGAFRYAILALYVALFWSYPKPRSPRF